MENKDIRDDRSKQAFGTLAGALALGLVGIVCYVCRPSTGGHWLSDFGISLLVAVASLAVGGFLGFLFGIPRTLQGELSTGRQGAGGPGDHAEDPSGSATYRANTNLEQISDWLTKILVGVGLTQLNKIPGMLSALGDYIAGGMSAAASNKTYAGVIVVFFAVCGFLTVFLWTRLYLAGALRHADLTSFLSRVKGQEEKDAKALSVANRQLNPNRDAPPISEEDLIAAVKDSSPSVRVQLFYQAQEVRTVNWSTDKEKMERTIPIFRGLVASDPEDGYHRNHAQLGYALKDKREPNWKEAEAELTKAIIIRDRFGEGGWEYYEFNRAVCRINLDEAYLEGRASSPENRDRILADLRVVAGRELKPKLFDEAAIRKWAELNRVNLEKLGP